MQLHANRISKRFGNDWVLRNVEFEAAAGSIFGILGPTASGKTTLLKILAGQIRSNDGSVIMDGASRISYYDGMDPKPLLGIFGGAAKRRWPRAARYCSSTTRFGI